jgi:hypothetical protein
LGTITAQQQPGSHLQVVASSFQAQLPAEKQHKRAPSVAAAEKQSASIAVAVAVAAEEGKALAAAAACASSASNATKHAVLSARTQLRDDDVTEEAAAHIPQQQQQQQQQDNQQQHSGVLQPKLSRTAGSLVRAASLLGYSCVQLHVDVEQMYDEDTWRQLFRWVVANALLMCIA